jgi:hypothetical protein
MTNDSYRVDASAATMVDEARLRTRVARYLKDQDGAERTLEEIAQGTGLSPEDVKAGIEHNHFVDSLHPNLYYGVIQQHEKEDRVTYRFNKAQYIENRSRWIDARGRRRQRGGPGGGGDLLSNLPKPGFLRRRKGGK